MLRWMWWCRVSRTEILRPKRGKNVLNLKIEGPKFNQFIYMLSNRAKTDAVADGRTDGRTYGRVQTNMLPLSVGA